MRNRLIFAAMLLVALLALSGCGVYGQGSTIGYVYAVDDGIVWDKIYYKSSLDSSETDCYLVEEDSKLKYELMELQGKEVKLYYHKHIFTWGSCPEGTSTEDEIVGYELVRQ